MAITDGLNLSAPISAVRYSNGKLIDLTATAAGFISYDYDPDTQQGTFKPASITVKATFNGDVRFKKWEYSNDGTYWSDAADTDDITTTSTTATILPTESLYSMGNLLIIRCVGDDDTTTETITITRTVDPLQIYRENHTAIEQTNDKIALIATEEQLREFADGQTTLTTKVATIEETADGFRQTVTRSYATKTDAQGYANSAQSAAISAAATDATTKANNARTGALNDAKGYVNTKLESYSTIEQTSTAITTAVASKTDAGEVRSIITQEADNIRLKADKIAWESDNSSMTESGVLSCKGAIIEGDLTMSKNNVKNYVGTIDFYNYGTSDGSLNEQTGTGLITQSLYGSSGTVRSYNANVIDTFNRYGNRRLILNLHYSDISTNAKPLGQIRASGSYDEEWITKYSDANIAHNISRRDKLYYTIYDSSNSGAMTFCFGHGDRNGAGQSGAGKMYFVFYDESGLVDDTMPITFMNEVLEYHHLEVATRSTSSERYKHDIKPVEDPELDPHKLYLLRVKQFVYNEDQPLQYQDMKDKPLIGFIAEDVAEIYPNAVIRNKDGTVESWDERRIVPPMLALIQEQKQEIENLKAELAELKAIVKEIRDAKN